MQFPNAEKGVKKFFIAPLLSLIASAVGIVVGGMFAAQNETVNGVIAVILYVVYLAKANKMLAK